MATSVPASMPLSTSIHSPPTTPTSTPTSSASPSSTTRTVAMPRDHVTAEDGTTRAPRALPVRIVTVPVVPAPSPGSGSVKPTVTR